MTINSINNFSKIYQEHIFESTGKKTLDPVGQEDEDIDNDGDTDNSDDYLHNRRKSIGRAISKKGRVKESFSSWRQDLSEVISSITKDKKVDDKKVNNKVKIHPNVSEEAQLLESVELSEEYVNLIVDLASQYFYTEGYGEDGVNIIAEGMGHDQFLNFVFDIGNTFFLDEAAYQGELLTSKGKARKNPKVSSAKGSSTPVSHTPSSEKKEKPEEKKTSPGQLSIDYNKKPSPPGQERIKQRVGDAVRNATSQKARKTAAKAAGSAVKGAANTAARVALSAWKGHKEAMKRKKGGESVARQVGAGLGAAAGAFFKKGKEHLKNSYDFSDWLDYIISEGCDISEWTINDLYKQYKLNEAIYGEVGKLNEMSVSRTKYKGLPKKVKESVDQIPMTPEQLSLQKKKSNIDLMIAKRRKQEIQNQKEEFVSEEDYDKMKDRQLERGGIGARSSNSPSNVGSSSTPVDPEKRRKAARDAFDSVKKRLITKYGKGSVM